jgi:thiamine-phosphate kinase
MSINSLTKRITALPPLDASGVQIQEICSQPRSSIADLTKVIENDPMLVANILKLANSPLYGFNREIRDVGRAVSLFGMASVKSFALSSSIKKNFDINLTPYGITEQTFLQISMMQNALMFNWYSRLIPDDLSILLSASFMTEVGKIITAHEIIEVGLVDEFKSKMQALDPIPAELSKLEKEMLGMSNEEVAAAVFEQWNLEDNIIAAILYSENVFEAPQHAQKYAHAMNIVKNAVNIFGYLTDANIEKTKDLLELYRMPVDKFVNAVNKLKATF